MTSQPALEALINLAIAYIVISIAASAAVELLSQILRVRGRILGNTIRGLLGESTTLFYEYPSVKALRQTGAVGAWLPIRWTRKVATNVTQGAAKKVFKEKAIETDASYGIDPAVDFIDAGSFAAAYRALSEDEQLPAELQKPEGPFKVGGQLQPDLVRGWFDQAMRATKRQYRRTAQLALFALGLAVAWQIDLDTAEILLTAFSEDGQTANMPDPRIGYVMSACAVALGAQYWFDTVGRLLGLRTKAVSSGLWGRAARKP